MNRALLHDFGAFLNARFADALSWTAGAGQDAVEQNGAWVAVPDEASSLVLIFAFEAVLADTKSLTIAHNLQDATDVSGTGAADFGTAVTATNMATSSGGTTEVGIYKVTYDLDGFGAGHRGFIRVQWTPDLDASGTDTAIVMPVYVFPEGKTRPVADGVV